MTIRRFWRGVLKKLDGFDYPTLELAYLRRQAKMMLTKKSLPFCSKSVLISFRLPKYAWLKTALSNVSLADSWNWWKRDSRPWLMLQRVTDGKYTFPKEPLELNNIIDSIHYWQQSQYCLSILWFNRVQFYLRGARQRFIFRK